MDIFNTILLIVTLSCLEISLSLDNAVALSSITDKLNPEERKTALDIGIAFSYIFRIGLLFCATWVIRYWQLKLVAAVYLFYLAMNYFFFTAAEEAEKNPQPSLFKAIAAVTLTDLAFSLDSVSAAVAVSDRFIVICVGCAIGVLALRFLTDLFMVWMEKFTYLETAGYLAICFVAAKLIAQVIFPELIVSELAEVGVIFLIFAFGFSKQNNTGVIRS